METVSLVVTTIDTVDGRILTTPIWEHEFESKEAMMAWIAAAIANHVTLLGTSTIYSTWQHIEA